MMNKHRTVYSVFFLGIVAVVSCVVISTLHTPLSVTLLSALPYRKKDSSKPSKDEKNSPMTEIITLASGLQYSIIEHGNGETTPAPGSVATVNYTGWLSDGGQQGKQFDSSIGRGPFSFVVGTGNVIKGWDEAVLQMRVGEKRRLIIPPQLGYGTYGYPGAIPGNATLIFEVELISFK